MRPISISEIKTYRSCPRKHKLRYLDGWRGHSSYHLQLGVVFHSAAERWWQYPGEASGKTGDALLYLDSVDSEQVGLNKYHMAAIRAMMRRYGDMWHDYDRFDAIAIEQRVKAAGGWRGYVGIVDLILQERSTGKHVLVDHKTTTAQIDQDDAPYFGRLILDEQIDLYINACAQSMQSRDGGIEIDTVVFDVMRKPTIRPLKATPKDKLKYTKDGELYSNCREKDETPKEYEQRAFEAIGEEPEKNYRRYMVPRTEDQIAKNLKSLDESQALIELSVSRRLSPKSGNCFIGGSSCEFWDICAFGVDPKTSTQFKKGRTIYDES